MNYIFDSHSHSAASLDAHSTVDEMAKLAIAVGLAGFSVTDHYDAYNWNNRDFLEVFGTVAENVKKAQEEYGHQIDITLGIELAEVWQAKEKSEKLLESYPFDFVIHSLHQMTKSGGIWLVDFTKLSEKETDSIIKEYYEELLHEITWGGGDVVGHITLPFRYIKLKTGKDFDILPYYEYIRALLRKIVELGMGIEINTSGIRTIHGAFMPNLELATMYRELGGEIITVGSDAHYAEHMGADIVVGMELLKEAGFRYFSVFHNRKSKFYSLD